MTRKLIAVLAAAVLTAMAARAADPIVYQYTRGDYYIFNSSGPAAVPVLDDGHLASPGGAEITDFRFAFSVPNLGAGATVDFDALVTFYKGKPAGQPFVNVKSPANVLASYRLPFRGVTASAVGLFATPTYLVDFKIPGQDFVVEYLFVSPDGVDVNDATDVAAPVIASGNQAVTASNANVGNSDDLMYTDDSYDGKYDATTAPTSFGDSVHNASIYLRMHGVLAKLPPWSVSLGAPTTGGVTVAEQVAYVAGSDGKLYACSTADGTVIAGFPVDINAAVGATVKLPSRPAVYYGKTGKAIYLTTDRGDVVRVLPTGQVAWHVRPLAGQTVSTPAVTPDGNVYVNLSTGSGPFDNFVFKLDEATGTPISLSPFLGYTTADNLGDFSPAANDRFLYVNSGWGSKSGLTLLNQDNLAVRSSFAGGEQCLSPLLLNSDLLLASKSGKAWKMNAVTLAPDLGFGHFGVADLGTPVSAAPFSDATGNVYIGTADGRILKWTPGAGSFTPFYTATGKIAGLTIDRTAGVLGFGTSNGSFVQVPLSDPSSATTVTPGGPISTGTVYEALTDRFIVVTDTGVLSGYPAIR